MPLCKNICCPQKLLILINNPFSPRTACCVYTGTRIQVSSQNRPSAVVYQVGKMNLTDLVSKRCPRIYTHLLVLLGLTCPGALIFALSSLGHVYWSLLSFVVVVVFVSITSNQHLSSFGISSPPPPRASTLCLHPQALTSTFSIQSSCPKFSLPLIKFSVHFQLNSHL